MKKYLFLILIAITLIGTKANALSVLTVPQGGTGNATFPVGDCIKGNGTGALTSGSCGTGGGSAFPFTVNSWGNSTTSTLGFLNGFLSTASSTISSSLRLPSISQGFLYTGSTGLVQPIASSSIQLSWFNNDSGFITSYTETDPIVKAINGIVKSNGSAISAATNGTDYTLITALTCSAGQHFSQVTAGGTFTCSADTGGSGTSPIATSTNEVANRLALWTSTSGTPATLGQTGAGTNGQVLALVSGVPTWVSTTTAGTGLSYNGTSFNVNTSQNISTLSNLTSNGAILTSGGTGALSIYTGTSCTNQFVRSLSGSIVATCATVANTDLANSSITINGSSVSLGGSITVASTTLLSDLNNWTKLQNFSNTTTTLASFTYASTTSLRIGLADGCLNITSGLVGSTGSACSSGGGGTYPFQLTGNATSTLTQFNGGLTAFASSTIGNGAQAGGLTISGGATTTGNAYVAGNLNIPQKASRSLANSNIFFDQQASIGSTNNDIFFYSWSSNPLYINNNYIGLDSGIVLNWGGSAADGGKDIGLSRLSSGRLAIGNGTAGSTAGSVSMAYSSTTGASFSYASSTLYYGAGLASCNSASNALTWSSGVFGCNTITGGSGNMSGWATTTISGQLLLYPVNSQTTDVAFGSSATTTAPFWWDVSATSTYIGNGGMGTSSMSFSGGTGTNKFWNLGAYSTSQSGFGNFYIASSSNDSDMTTNQFFTIEQGGDVGIGSSTPFGLFSINGTSAIGSSPIFVIGSSSATNLIVTNRGWFGYGTSSPDSQFTIQGDNTTNDVFDIDLSNGDHALQFMSNGKAGFGTSTPWAQLSVQALSTYDNKLPLFNFSTSSTPFGQLLSLFSTTTTLRGSVTGGDSGARLLFGQASSTIPTLDQLSGDFRTNSDWGTMGCDTIGSGLLAQLTANANGMTCPGLSFFEDAAAVADYTADVGGGSAYLRLRTGATGVTSAAGNGFVIKPLTATWSFATNTPVMEITGRIVPANASSTLFIVGFTNYTGTTANVETLPTAGCFLVASSSQANWQLISNNAGTMTQTDTGVASTSNSNGVGTPSFQKIRVEADSNRCTSWITVRGGVATKTEITSNISTSIALSPSVSAGNFTTAGLTKEFHLRSIRVWFKGLNNL